MEFVPATLLAVERDKEPVTGDRVSELLKSRGWNNAQFARFFGVDRWTVGAWINGNRTISEKHQQSIKEMIYSPIGSHPTLYPLSQKISREIRKTESHELSQVEETATRILDSCRQRFQNESLRSISQETLDSLTRFLNNYNDQSIAQVLERLALHNAENLRFTSLPSVEAAREIAEAFPMGGSGSLEMEIDEDNNCLYAHYKDVFTFDEEEVENHPEVRTHYPNGEPYVDEIAKERFIENLKKDFVDKVEFDSYTLFRDTAFEHYPENDQWLDRDTYSTGSIIHLDDPHLKESLRLVYRRM